MKIIKELKKLKTEDYFAFISAIEALGFNKAKQILDKISNKNIEMFYNTSKKSLSDVLIAEIEKERKNIGKRIGTKQIPKLLNACGIEIEKPTENTNYNKLLALGIVNKVHDQPDKMLNLINNTKNENNLPDDAFILDCLTNELKPRINSEDYQRLINSISILFPEYNFS